MPGKVIEVKKYIDSLAISSINTMTRASYHDPLTIKHIDEYL